MSINVGTAFLPASNNMPAMSTTSDQFVMNSQPKTKILPQNWENLNPSVMDNKEAAAKVSTDADASPLDLQETVAGRADRRGCALPKVPAKCTDDNQPMPHGPAGQQNQLQVDDAKTISVSLFSWPVLLP